MAFATELLVKSTLALDEMVAEKVAQIQPDLIISDSVAYWGKLTAIKYNIPYASSTTTFAFNDASSKYMTINEHLKKVHKKIGQQPQKEL